MEHLYHRQVLTRALGGRVSARALAAITAANLGQDSLWGLVGHPEFHGDESKFPQMLAYIEQSRAAAARAAAPGSAWAAFGRLSHAAQDFYSHSNYVALWLEARAGAARIDYPDQAKGMDTARWPAAAAIDGLDPQILQHPRLMSGNVYYPVEALWLFPALHTFVKRLVPKDAHAWMNLDFPETGPLFAYSIEAAVQRTAAEFDRTLAAIGEELGAAAARSFLDRAAPAAV